MVSCLMDWSTCKAHERATNVELCLQLSTLLVRRHNTVQHCDGKYLLANLAARLQALLKKKGNFPHSDEILVLLERKKKSY
eukprot:scaffold174856_cov22-Tisochrysis_lutea.AAC.2